MEKTRIRLSREKMTEITLCCPGCKQYLLEIKDELSCPQCQLTFTKVLGIPDLRYPPNPPSSEDETRVGALIKHFNHTSFDQLVSTFLDGAHLSSEIMNKTLSYYRNQETRSEKMVNMLLDRYQENYALLECKNVLDLGCGSGGGAGALSKRFQQIYSIDDNMSQLILAKKYFEEKRITNVGLVCARAQSLPFPPLCFDYVQAVNLLEHLEDAIHQVFQEVFRTLTSGGGFAADSRNRYDIFMPEPHSGIRFLGFLPRKMIPGFVRKTTGNHYLSTRLLSYRELSSIVKSTIQHYKIVFPMLGAYGQPTQYDQLLRMIERYSGLSMLLIRFFSTHILVARKQTSV